VTVREAYLRFARVFGGTVGYGCLAAFVSLVGFQVYRWFKDGEWTHIGVNDGLRAALARPAGAQELTGRLAGLSHWLDAPVDWLGLHRVLEAMPASLALFALSILGNAILICASDRIRERRGGGSSSGGSSSGGSSS
jgi:hypothetical protein